VEIYMLDTTIHRLVMAQSQIEVDEIVKRVVHELKPDQETLEVIRRVTETRRFDLGQRQLDPELPDFDDYTGL